MGRIYNATFKYTGELSSTVQQKPYAIDEKMRSPRSSSALRCDDIEGASPNAFGKAKDIKGKDYMKVNDIEGARPRGLEREEHRALITGKNRRKDVEDYKYAESTMERRSKRLRRPSPNMKVTSN